MSPATLPAAADSAADFTTDVLVIGAGQSGLAVGYYLRRAGLAFQLLDDQPMPGGSWPRGWNSLRLFSPADASSLPGWLMPRPPDAGGFPARDAVTDYLTRYEQRYGLPVRRPVRVTAVQRLAGGFGVETDAGPWRARAVVCATGSWRNPFVPQYPGQASFGGVQLHSAQYREATPFTGQRVLVAGGGNSGAQVLAEVSRVARTTWVTEKEPRFLPDDVDGRVLFTQATQRYHALASAAAPPPTLGDIVMVPPVQEARGRAALGSVRPFGRFTPTGVVWADGREEAIDVVIWCTGFRPALSFLAGLGVVQSDGRVATEGARATAAPGLWLVGYGSWTGFASATLIGVGRSARTAVDEIKTFLGPAALVE